MTSGMNVEMKRVTPLSVSKVGSVCDENTKEKVSRTEKIKRTPLLGITNILRK